MICKIGLVGALLLSASLVEQPASTPVRVLAASLATINCSATTLSLHPGLNPGARNMPPGIAPDIPRGRFVVALPLFPGAIPLKSYVASPFAQHPANAYLQTGSAEYQSADDEATVTAWFRRALPHCGWRADGNWNTNASTFTAGLFWASATNSDLTLDLSFGSSPSGGTYFGYGVEEVTYPPRPASSYLHGSFSQVRIALQRGSIQQGGYVPHVGHDTVIDGGAIKHLVKLINAVSGYHTVSPLCSGGLSLVGPAWLSFIRPDGTVVHAFESGPGECGGLAVNGVRWLTDEGAVWKQILTLGGRG
jgi:hypothetical protein